MRLNMPPRVLDTWSPPLSRPKQQPKKNSTEARKRATAAAHVKPKAYLPSVEGMLALLRTSRALTNVTLLGLLVTAPEQMCLRETYVMRMAARAWKKLAPKTTMLLTPEPTRVNDRRPVITVSDAKMSATR